MREVMHEGRMDQADEAKKGRELPSVTYATQPEARALMVEAAGDLPLSPDLNTRANVVRLMAAAWAASGTFDWPRGWVAETMTLLERERCHVPTQKEVRWYRCAVASNPMQFRRTRGAPVELLEQIELDLFAEG